MPAKSNGHKSLKAYRPQRVNANKHTPIGLDALRKSIQGDGMIGAITVARDGETFDGSARLETLADAMPGVKIVEVETDGLTLIINKRRDIPNAKSPRAKRLGVAANVIAKLDYNPDGEILAALAAEDKMIAELVKADRDSLRAVTEYANENGGADAEPQINRAEELNKKWKVKMGDLWRIGEHRLLCEDSMVRENVARVMEGEKVDLLLTDPPYGINVVSNLSATIGGGKPVTIGSLRSRRKDTFGGVKAMGRIGATHWVDATLYAPVTGDDKPFDPSHLLSLDCDAILFGGNYYASKLPDSRCWIVWDKDNTGNFADCELAWTSFETGAKLYKFTWNGLVREGARNEEGVKRFHPTQKPVGLFKMILEDFSEEGDVILDCYLGSGTTLVACQNLNRIGRGIEILPAYCAVTLERMATAFPGIEIERIP